MLLRNALRPNKVKRRCLQNYLLQLCRQIAKDTREQSLRQFFSRKVHSPEEKKQLLCHALNVYHGSKSGNQLDPSNVNLYLKLCLHFKSPNHALHIWGDIQNSNCSNKVMFPLLFKCFLESNAITECMETLKMMNRHQYQFRDQKQETEHSINITKLIRFCGSSSDTTTLHEIKGVLSTNNNIFIGTELIRQFARHKLLDDALLIFHSIAGNEKDIIIVTIMMRAFIDSHRHHDALSLYQQYQSINDAVSHMLALESCVLSDDEEHFRIGKEIHFVIPREQMTIKLKSALIDFYGHFGDIQTASDLFDSIPGHQKDSISVNALMTQLNRNEKYTECTALYQRYCLLNNAVSHLLALKAWTNLGDFYQCQCIERKMNMNSADIVGKTALIDCYCHFGDVVTASKIFDSMKWNTTNPKAIESVNAMMTGYLKNEHYQSALELYDRFASIHDDVSHLLALKTCIHTEAKNRGFGIYRKFKNREQISNALQNTLIEFLGHFQDIQSAQEIFERIESANKMTAVSVAVMMKALITNGCNEEALIIYDRYGALQSDAGHLLCIRACINNENYQRGRDLHHNKLIGNEGNCGNNSCSLSDHLKTALLEFYGHFGDIEASLALFNDLDRDKMDIVPFNAMMNAYAKNGEMDKAQKLYIEAKRRGKVMSGRTFIALINACSHCGDVSEAERIWSEEIGDEDIKYDRYVVSSVVDCFARGGELGRGRDLILEYEKRTGKYNQVMWMSLMSGCRNLGDLEMKWLVYEDITNRFVQDKPYMRAVDLLAGV